LRDVVRFRRQFWIIDGWQKDGPSLRRLDRFERTGASWRDMEKSTVMCSTREQHDVEVLNRDSSAVEVMDPTDYSMITVGLPYDDDGTASRLRIGFIDGAWLALPGAADEV
jgi:NMD protein affecting ribosome stability and mRNA decay